MRYALRVYYDGKDFFGSQTQPDKRTVEGELRRALGKLGVDAGNLQSAGRTDRGVSSLGNVFALNSNFAIRPRALNSFLPEDVRVLGVKDVEEDFNPRYSAIERTYKYFLYNDGYSIEKIKNGAKILEGEHSFHNFCRSEKNPIRRIKRISIKTTGDFLIVTIVGESFLWQMVRRIATALKMLGMGELSSAELRQYLDPKTKNKIPPSAPEGLLLWEVRYPFGFEYEDYSMRNFADKISASRVKHSTRALIDEQIIKELAEFK